MTGKQCQPDDSEDNQSRIKLIADKRRLLEEKSAQVRHSDSLSQRYGSAGLRSAIPPFVACFPLRDMLPVSFVSSLLLHEEK